MVEEEKGKEEEPPIKDSIKLLLMVKAMTNQDILVDGELLPSYIYLLNTEKYLSFHYVFTFDPLPYSKDISEDTEAFIKIGFIRHSSPIMITEFGESWLAPRMPTLEKYFTKIKEAPLSKWVKMDPKHLFDYIYGLISKV